MLGFTTTPAIGHQSLILIGFDKWLFLNLSDKCYYLIHTYRLLWDMSALLLDIYGCRFSGNPGFRWQNAMFLAVGLKGQVFQLHPNLLFRIWSYKILQAHT